MTGYGQARVRDSRDAVEVEVRSVNHRYLKVHTHMPERFAMREAEVEEAVRGAVKRGTVDIDVRVRTKLDDAAEPFDAELLKAYHKRLAKVQKDLGVSSPVSMDALLALPGVVRGPDGARNGEDKTWPKVAKALAQALEDLDASRAREGDRLKKPLRAILKEISRLLCEVRELAPTVVEAYRDRLKERVARLLSGTDAPVPPADLGREVALFADRCDISEEIARQESHVTEFDKALGAGGDVGRRLDFIAQEMLREANTMGAKANDARLTSRIISMKAEIEKIKEQIQNIE
jgi:uncharacterized protein (TIGR00255 family)